MSSRRKCIAMSVVIRKILDNRDPHFKDFLYLPELIYEGNPNWVEPLVQEVSNKLDPKKNSLLSYAKVSNYVAYDNNNIARGRITVIINPQHNNIHNENVGFFGMYESFNDIEIAKALFNKAVEVINKEGCSKLIGPVNLTTNDESGFLFDGYDKPPTFMCNYCQPYYHDLLKAYGFSKAVDTYSYMTWHGHPFPEKYYKLVKKISSNKQLSLRKINKKAIEEDILTIASIYNSSFSDIWGFVPISDIEALELGKNLLPIIDDELIWIAKYDGKPVGIIMGFPDINELIKDLKGRLFPRGLIRFAFFKNRIQGMRIAALGVEKKYRRLGIETALIHKVHLRVQSRPYKRSEFSVVFENNTRMRNLLEQFGFSQAQRFRIYQKTIPELS